MDKKEKLLSEIEGLMSYGKEDETIGRSLSVYLDESALESIAQRLRKRRENLIDEEREWLAGFIKEE